MDRKELLEQLRDLVGDRDLSVPVRYDAKNRPVPPWEMYPQIPRLSIGWRMGAGEDYKSLFVDWFFDIFSAERQSYIEDWPEPEDWAGFYDLILERTPAMKNPK